MKKKDNSWESYEAYVEEQEKLDWRDLKKICGAGKGTSMYWEGREGDGLRDDWRAVKDSARARQTAAEAGLWANKGVQLW